MPVGPRFFDLLEVLCRHEIAFILVGGVAAIVHGAPVMTDDLDIVYRNEAENVTRLAQAMAEIRAVYRDPAGRRFEPTEDRLSRQRVNLLRTDLGPLDVLQSIGENLAFEDLAPNAPWFELSALRVRVLDLATIIASKEQANRPKDRATLPLLRAVLTFPDHQSE